MDLPTIDAIPHALASRPQWVVWRYEQRDTASKPTKVPYQALAPARMASSTAPRTWASVDAALATAEKHRFDGIGYVFSPDDPFAGFDLDNILDDAGHVADWAQPWLASLATYTEVSPSGHGVKGIAIGTLPGNGINAGSVELYDHGRYFAITGRRFDDAPAEPQAVNGALDKLYAFAVDLKQQHDAEREQRRQIAYAQAALASEADKVRSAAAGTRNDALNTAAFALASFIAKGLLTEDAIADELTSAASAAGLGAAEIRTTIRSGLRAGAGQERTIPQAQEVGRKEDAPKASPSRKVDYVVDLRQHGISAADLQKVVFAALIWVIDGILPEGTCLLAGKPKSKKSWLALAVACAVALGGKVLSYYDVTAGDVLYLDLESNQRRMKSRLTALLGTTPWPANLHIFTKWERGESGIALLDAWMEAHPNTRLIVIDILQNFRPPRDPKGNPYDQDYEALGMITAFAERHRTTVMVIHHTRKAKADDIFDEISGTTGLTGAATSMWALARTPDNTSESILALRGKDIVDDEPMALRWDTYTCQFVRVASGAEVSSSAARRAILDVMDIDQEYQLKEIAAAVGKTVSATANQVRRLMDDNLIHRVGNGRYARVPSRQPDRRESRESRESPSDGESHESLGAEEAIDFHDFHVLSHGGSESLLPQQDAPESPSNRDFHDFHSDLRESASDTDSDVLSDDYEEL